MVAPEECAVANRQSAVVPSEECRVANRGECCVAVFRTDNVAAPNRNLNLGVSVENWSVFDENWGVLDENSGSTGLPAWPAFLPNNVPR